MGTKQPLGFGATSLEEMTRAVLEAVPAEVREGARGDELAAAAQALAEALVAADQRLAASGSYSDEDLQRVNEAAERIHAFDEGFTLSDLDDATQSRSAALRFNTHNLFMRLRGRADHEAEWDGERWTNWNDLVACWPEHWHAPSPADDGVDDAAVYAPVQEVVRDATTLRVVAGGHAFNESASTGGTDTAHTGSLLSLDDFRDWRRLDSQEAARDFGLDASSPSTLVRVQAGIRLRDFTNAMWSEGLAMPVSGSTDTQSMGGLIASDLHGSGRNHGFLAEQIHQLRLVRADGTLVTFSRSDGGWVTDEPEPRTFAKLPVAGALGMLGVVVDAVIELVPAYHLARRTVFVERAPLEADLTGLFASNDHVNVFYPVGGTEVRTVQLNTLNRTEEQPSWSASLRHLVGELGDHALVSYAPDMLYDMAVRDPATDRVLKAMNAAGTNVLPAPLGFNRRLYYVHDEVEYAFPADMAQQAIDTTIELLRSEEVHSIVEMRSTPDSAQSMIGPGTAGAGRGGAVWIGIAAAVGDHSRARLLQFFELYDRAVLPLGGRPHLGKQTAMDNADMAATYGDDWTAFQALRREWDPTDTFLPERNTFLRKLFA